MKITTVILVGVGIILISCSPKWKESGEGDIRTVTNEGGQTLAYSASSGVKILTVDRFGFKDLNKNGSLDPYEDWRLSADDRAKDLASKMTVEQIAGLMLYSRHQAIPAPPQGFRADTYNGKPLAESGMKASDVSDGQRKFITEDKVRHILVTSVESPEVAAAWNNNVQALTESIDLGIPANNSSDPRHGTNATAEFNEGAGGSISMWPGSLGLAATFDPALVKEFGRIASIEYRSLGITTALSPQVDIATDPRWLRVSGTFGEHPQLSADIGRAYIDGFQTSSGEKEIKDGWGYESVNAMVKHWPGGASGEGGRDAHYGFGKFAVYPGGQFETHFIPFTEGAFKLEGKTGMASAIMPYYTISWGQDKVNKENVGNSYNKYIITDLLRDKYKFDGVACTDWGITPDETALDVFIGGKPWGVESLTVAERHYKILMAGVDQFGGNNELAPVIEAYNIGVKEHGEEFMRRRFEQSAVRLLKNIFRPGLFENPYLDVEASKSIVGKPEFMKAGYEAQLKSVVMLKNSGNALPLAKGKKVYIPKKFTPGGRNFLGAPIPETLDYPVNLDMVKKYFEVTDNPEEADYGLAFIGNPNSGLGYDAADAKKSNGYLPISLQYGEYTAKDAREQSIAGGDPLEKFTNRTYRNKKVKAINITDLGMVNDTKKKMKNKPVIVIMQMSNPAVFSEIEPNAAGILVHFGVQHQALFELLTGAAEPSALLPLQMPLDMTTVEKQAEDVPFDMTCYVDKDGNTYDFGFGLNWKGVISDARVEKYKKK
ncbi:MAG TPA: glycoside hydrolase family 3 N-terminal domain-containing protein [Cyclobacteriaceae bacterium]|nr:glycoside hydrolase family 3 N-terminal domain-containing protein [Cyclobacteriaceae bacterium]